MAKRPFQLLIFDWNGTLYDVAHADSLTNGKLFPGTHEALNDLHAQGYLLAIATAASKRSLLAAIESNGLNTPFIAMSTGDQGFGKPHPQVIQSILASTGLLPKDALMIGDTLSDMQCANNAGVAALAVGYGLDDKAKLMRLQPLGCINEISELPNWLHHYREKDSRAP
jgi:phosphoglycolate phosphatase